LASGGIFGLMAMMKKLAFDERWILAFSLLIFVLTMAVEGVLIQLLWRQKSEAKETSDSARRLKEQATKELDAAEARSLPEPLQSVTEHTTRTLEPLYSKRKSK
jgi:FtsZ-interacting cell division protein ZipA